MNKIFWLYLARHLDITILMQNIKHLHFSQSQVVTVLYLAVIVLLSSSCRCRLCWQSGPVAGQDPVPFLSPGAPFDTAQITNDPLRASL